MESLKLDVNYAMHLTAKLIAVAIGVFLYINSYSQTGERDSLIEVVKSATDDTSRVLNLVRISRLYLYKDPATGLKYGIQVQDIASKIKFARGEAGSLNAMGNCYRLTGIMQGPLLYTSMH